MVSALGNFSLWSSLFFALLQFLNFNSKNFLKYKYGKIAVIGLFISILVSFFTLMYGFIISDFTILNVYQNSHTTKPLIYKISAVWGSHEGSMLLWLLVLIIFNYFIFKLNNKKNFEFIYKSLETQSLLIIGFLAFTILTSNPFETVVSNHNDGLGFNPILQDPALAIHPPLLYFGYVGFSSVFSLSIAVLCSENTKNIPWYIYMKPFAVASWTFLSIGIAFGALWAYYELGWGGWWFWDPVENASLMPWLLGTALLHSLITVERKKSFQSWVLLLSILVFLLSVVGTFLVRSGILTSVHTFALDPTRGIYILFFFTLVSIYSLALFGINSKKFSSINHFSFLTKESGIFINNIIMTIVCATVLLGTIYPLVVEAFTNSKISVGAPYYNSVVIPIMIPAIIFMGLSSTLSWGNNNPLKILMENLKIISVTILITLIFFFFYKSFSFLGVLGIFLSVWIIVNNLKSFLIKKNIKKISIGMIVAHLGFGFLILGITGSSVWQEEKIVRLKISETTQINKYSILFDEIKEIKEQNFLAIRGSFVVYNNKNKIITKLFPENRYYPVTKNFTTEASIHSNIIRDFYIVLGEGKLNEGWIVRIYYNPLVMWIWIGALTIFAGGLISMFTNLKKVKTV